MTTPHTRPSVAAPRTPYHDLGCGAPRVPKWVRHRSVYRTAGRTLYLVNTDSLDAARRDLNTLLARGWEVQIDQSDAHRANISLSRAERSHP